LVGFYLWIRTNRPAQSRSLPPPAAGIPAPSLASNDPFPFQDGSRIVRLD